MGRCAGSTFAEQLLDLGRAGGPAVVERHAEFFAGLCLGREDRAGRLRRHRRAAIVCGAGASASGGVTAYLREHPARLVVIAGVCGGLDPSLPIFRDSFTDDGTAVVLEKLAHILSGGRLTGEQTVSEQYLLDLEREAFLSLCGNTKTQERMAHTLKTGKPLRN